jgi:predicted site-specific integrase-resolvase
MSNVIKFKFDIPTDLMTFKEIEEKHGIKYQYLYKWACTMGQIRIFNRGKLKLSEKEVLDFTEKRALKYGRH